MTDHAPFIAAIVARPLDDLPRLIYADWLEATAGMVECSQCVDGWIGCVFRDADGDRSRTSKAKCDTCHGTGSVSNGHAERAEFIRVQCRLAEHERAAAMRGNTFLPVPAMPPGFLIFSKREALRRRERELLFARRERDINNGIRWLGFSVLTAQTKGEGPIPTVAIGLRTKTTLDAECVYRRGFVEEITCSWPDWQRHAAAIRAATPLRRVRLTTWPELGEVTADERRHVREVWPYEYEPDRIAILRQRYPGIEFELPQRAGLIGSWEGGVRIIDNRPHWVGGSRSY